MFSKIGSPQTALSVIRKTCASEHYFLNFIFDLGNIPKWTLDCQKVNKDNSETNKRCGGF